MGGTRKQKGVAPSSTPANFVDEFPDSANNNYPTAQYEQGHKAAYANIGLYERNILTNGSFLIQQRIAVASTAIAGISTTTRAGVVADRWAVTTSVASNLNWQQVDTSAAPETGLQSRYYGSMICATAGKKVMISQFIINARMMHLLGKKVRLSVKINVKVGNAKNMKLGLLQLTSAGTVDTCPAFLSGAWSTSTGVDPSWGTNLSAITPDAVTGENGTVTGNYLVIAAQQTTWQRSSAVFTVPTNAKNLVFVLFDDATGGTTDNTSVAEFQLTQGTEIVDYVEPPTSETLLECQRFFCKSFPLTVVPAASVAVATGGNGATNTITRAAATALASFINIVFPIKMFKTPTALTLFGVTGAGAVPWRISGAASAAQTAAATTGLLDTGAVVSSTGDAAGVVGDLVAVHYTAEAEFIT